MLFSIYKNNKIIRENKGKIMKESEFQQFLIEQFEKQNNFNEQQLKFNEFVTHEFAKENLMNYFQIVWILLKIDLQD